LALRAGKGEEGSIGASSFFPYPVPSGDEGPDELVFMPGRTPEQWDRLLAFVERRPFRAREEVIRRGEIDRALYIVIAGELQARLHEGRAGQGTALPVPAGSVIGEIGFFDGKARTATVTAVSDGELLRLSFDSFQRLATSEPELARAMLLDLGRILAVRLRQTDEFIRAWIG
jgi:CRP/FNR family transcriptional regulator, cyclic AMP receptor protein